MLVDGDKAPAIPSLVISFVNFIYFLKSRSGEDVDRQDVMGNADREVGSRRVISVTDCRPHTVRTLIRSVFRSTPVSG